METRAELIARNQFRIFERAGDEAALSEEARRRVLLLSPEEWSAWSHVNVGGALPNTPALPVMLRRLGAAAYRLEKMAERRTGRGD